MDYIAELQFAVKYPFTSLAREIVSRMGVSFDSLDQIYIDRAIQRIKEDLSGGVRLNTNSKLTRVLEVELISFPVAKILATLSNNSFLKKQFVAGESNALRRNLSVEDPDIIRQIAEELGVHISDSGIFFKNYLKYLPPDDNYKLVYQEISKGYVKVSDDIVVDILAVAFSRKLESDLSKRIEGFDNLKHYLGEIAIPKSRQFTYSGPVDADAFPPCMKAILSDAVAGVHLGHNARFAIATFLANVGLDPDKIVDVFRKQDNFNERLTRYHIDYILGKKGGNKRLPPSCEKMKLYGLCVNPDSLCKRVKNPLGYYRVKIKSRRRGNGPKDMVKS